MLYHYFKIALLAKENSIRLLAEVSNLPHDNLAGTGSLGTPVTPPEGTVGTSCKDRYPARYSLEDYIRLQTPRTYARLFAILPTGEAFVTPAGIEEQETAFAGWFKMWKRWGAKRNQTVETHAQFLNMTFIRSSEKFTYKGRLTSMMTQLQSNAVVRESVSSD